MHATGLKVHHTIGRFRIERPRNSIETCSGEESTCEWDGRDWVFLLVRAPAGRVGFRGVIGDPAKIKAKRAKKQKTDRQDAQLLLKLFPAWNISACNARPATKDASWITWDLTLLSRVPKSLVRIAGAWNVEAVQS